MTTGSAAPHRAFIGVAATISVCLMLALIVGWQWFGHELKRRSIIMERARVHEARVRELEKLGLNADAGIINEEDNAEKVTLNETAPKMQDTSSPTAAAIGIPPLSIVKELPLQSESADFKEAQALLENYWKATDVKTRLPLVHDSARIEPYMRQFYEIDREVDPDHAEMIDKKRLLIDGHEILYFSYKSSRSTGMLEIAMRRGDSGSFLLDWESYVGRCAQTFPELRQSRSTDPVMVRCFVRLFEYYNYEFTDSDRYLCVKMIAANGVDTLYGYCLRDSELGTWLSTQLAGTASGDALSGYTMKVAYPENAQSDQCVYIREVITPRWLALTAAAN